MHHLTLLVGALLAASGVERSKLNVDQDEWIAFMKTHNKSYETEHEETLRRIVYAFNKHQVEQFNANSSSSSKMALNHLADMSSIEIKSTMNGFAGVKAAEQHKMLTSVNSLEATRYLNQFLRSTNDTKIPDSLDWRTVPGRVGPVRNQGQHCGSCWAFSAAGCLEGQEFRKKNVSSFGDQDLVGLSVQNLIDCDRVDAGCQGGLMGNAFEFVAKEGGLDDWNSYPYEARKKKCRFNKKHVAMKDSGAAIMDPSGDEEKLKQLVATFGPVSVAIDANHSSFMMYNSGVYSSDSCKNNLEGLDHGVLVVGYGTDSKHGDYWIVKNSWGKAWGMDGYVLMARNKNNMCGIATYAVIPMI